MNRSTPLLVAAFARTAPLYASKPYTPLSTTSTPVQSGNSSGNEVATTSGKIVEAEELEGVPVGGRVKVSKAHVDSYPSASEAPELLESYVAPKPFVSAKGLQAFVASLAVGGLVVGSTYYLLSKTISDDYDKERELVYAAKERNRLAVINRQELVPDFTAPSSYEELKSRMKQHDQELERQRAIQRSRIVLFHQEFLFRMKLWWNRSLTNLQDSSERYGTAYKNRRERIARDNIEAVLNSSGYDLQSLKVGENHV